MSDRNIYDDTYLPTTILTEVLNGANKKTGTLSRYSSLQ